MNIYESCPISKKLNELKNGDCFFYKGELYMRVLGPWTHFDYNALNIQSGNFKKFHESERLMPVEAVVVLKPIYGEFDFENIANVEEN